MVDKETKPQTETKSEKPVNPRDAIREARQRRLRLINSGKASTIKVFAASEDLRAVLRHPTGTRFRATLDQPVEWPNDSFTHRRLREGSVSTEAATSREAVSDDESLNPRQQSAARYGKQAAVEEKQSEKPDGSKPARPSHQPAKPEAQPTA